MSDNDTSDPVLFDCMRCKAPVHAGVLLTAPASPWRMLRVVTFDLPCCGACEELSPGNGTLERGYTYAAGSPHFCGMETHAVRGLHTQWDGDDVILSLGGQTRRIVLRR